MLEPSRGSLAESPQLQWLLSCTISFFKRGVCMWCGVEWQAGAKPRVVPMEPKEGELCRGAPSAPDHSRAELQWGKGREEERWEWLSLATFPFPRRADQRCSVTLHSLGPQGVKKSFPEWSCVLLTPSGFLSLQGKHKHLRLPHIICCPSQDCSQRLHLISIVKILHSQNKISLYAE